MYCTLHGMVHSTEAGSWSIGCGLLRWVFVEGSVGTGLVLSERGSNCSSDNSDCEYPHSQSSNDNHSPIVLNRGWGGTIHIPSVIIL